ncbi:MAG: DcrB/PsbP domain-containing protein [Planctomycetota bacterium]
MKRAWQWFGLAMVLPFVLVACGGGKKKTTKGDGPVGWKEVSKLNTSLKVPKTFKKVPGGAVDAVQYMLAGNKGLIAIEKGKLPEGDLDALYKSEYVKRQRDTRKRLKREEAYQIIEKKDITLGAYKAFELEQEFQSGTGDQRAHNIVINVKIGEEKLLTIKWEVPDIKELSWKKAYSRYFKESRSSLRIK